MITRMTHLAKDTQEPCLNIEPFSITIDEIQLLCIHVLPGNSKPVFIKDRAPLGGKACFKRSGATTIPMSIQEIKDMLSHSQELFYDASPLKDASLNDLDFNLISNVITTIENEMSLSPKTISILTENQILNLEKNITVSGWLCFSKEPQKIRQLRNAYIEFQIFQGVTRDTPLKKYEIKGPLSQQIEQAVLTLKQHIWLIPQIHELRRIDTPAYSDLILREVITNSLVHRDYTRMHQPVKIALFTNRIEIENPGGLLPGITVDNLIHKRDWRNPLLAEHMKKFGFGEMDGQGIDRLYAQILKIRIPPPLIEDLKSSFKLTLSAPKGFDEFTAVEKRLTLIIMAIMNESIDNESVRSCFGITPEKASTLIKAMVSEDILEHKTLSRKYAKYILSRSYRERIYGS